MEGVDGAPEVCNFVLEETAGEGEDAVGGLGKLKERRVIPRLGIVEGGWERFKQR